MTEAPSHLVASESQKRMDVSSNLAATSAMYRRTDVEGGVPASGSLKRPELVESGYPILQRNRAELPSIQHFSSIGRLSPPSQIDTPSQRKY